MAGFLIALSFVSTVIIVAIVWVEYASNREYPAVVVLAVGWFASVLFGALALAVALWVAS